MPIFSYIAVDSKNNQSNGTVDQPDRTSAINMLVKQGLRPISVREIKKEVTHLSLKGFFGKDKVKTDQLVMFTRQLSAMIGAGVPLLRALSSLSEHIAESPVLKRILNGVIRDIESGSTLGDALEKYPNTFNDVYVNMVRAGETAGILDDTLQRLALQQEKSTTLRKKIKSSMSYPIVLLGITGIAFFGLMLFVIPQIGKVLKDLGGANTKLPALTMFMLDLSKFFISYWYLVFAILGGGIYGAIRYTKTKSGKYRFHYLLIRVPIFNKIIKKVAIAHFARTFSALIEAGVAMLEALNVTSRAVGNVIYENALKEAENDVKNGKTLSTVIAANPLFPPIVSQMLLVGEETGQTDKVLVKVADFYEEEVDMAISGLSSIIEPIMIVIMGGMVGLIAASVMLPIAGLAQSIK